MANLIGMGQEWPGTVSLWPQTREHTTTAIYLCFNCVTTHILVSCWSLMSGYLNYMQFGIGMKTHEKPFALLAFVSMQWLALE